VVDLFDRPIKFDGLVGTAVLRESPTAVMSYKGITIQADPDLANNEVIDLVTTRDGLQGLPFGRAGGYRAVTGVIITDVEYDKVSAATATTTGSHSTNLTLLTLDVHSNVPNYPTFVPLKFWSALEDLHSTATNFVCWAEIGILGIDLDLTSGQVGSRKGLMIAGPARKFAIGGILGDTAGPVTLLGLVDTLEGPTAASPACQAGTGVPNPLPCIPIERTSGNERSFMYEVYNNSVPVPTQFIPFSGFAF
jgi:hypothetical protein